MKKSTILFASISLVLGTLALPVKAVPQQSGTITNAVVTPQVPTAGTTLTVTSTGSVKVTGTLTVGVTLNANANPTTGLDNSGTVSATSTGDAVTLTGTATGTSTTLTNETVGTMSATGSGGAVVVAGSNASSTITNNGLITESGSGTSVGFTGSSTTSTFTNNGSITQSSTGRAVRDTGTGTTLTINNNGAISAVGSDSFQFKDVAGSITLNNYGTISTTHADEGANTTGTGDQGLNWNVLNADGTTTSHTNTLYNYGGASITAYEADAIRPGSGAIIYNSGTIQSTNASDNTSSSDGIDAQDNNTGITIVNGSSLTAKTTNANLIEGARHGITGGTQVDTIDTAGSTGGMANGIFDQPFTMSITNNANSTIKGDNGSGINLDGVDGTEKVTVVNNGIIQGNGFTRDGDGVDIDGVVSITNTGTIRSLSASNPAYNGTTNATLESSEGITVGGGTIINSGTIEGSVANDSNGHISSVGRGITLAGIDHTETNGVETDIPIEKIYANPFGSDGTTTTANPTGTTYVTNLNGGLIKGDTDSGIAIMGVNTNTGTSLYGNYTAQNYPVVITNNAGGTIEGSGSVAVIDGSATAGGVGTASANNETIINSGIIKVDGTGKAISLGSGTNSVQILGGSTGVSGNGAGGTVSINGDISGGTTSGSNSLIIDPNSNGTLSNQQYNYGYVLSNFGSVEIKSGLVDLSGANTYTGTTTIDTNATLDLTGNGTIGTTTTLTIGSGATFDLGGKTITVGSLSQSGGSIVDGSVSVSNGGSVSSSSGTVGGLSGNVGFTKTGTGTTTITGTNTYTGGTSVTGGKLSVNGSITGNVSVSTGAEVGGHGLVGGTIGGAGAVGPGNSPGILTAGATDPSSGLSYNFEFTQAGVPTWSNPSSSGNDVLHLTLAMPFTQPLSSSNVINLYFASGQTVFEGGFFTNGSTDNLTSNIAGATFKYYLEDSAGIYSYNGNKYDLLTATIPTSVVAVSNAPFSDGTVSGFTERFDVSSVPEPSTYAMMLLGLALLMLCHKLRRRV